VKKYELSVKILDEKYVDFVEHYSSKLSEALLSAHAEGRKEGKDKWYKAGWEDGKKEGMEEAAKIIKEMAQAIRSATKREV